MKSLVLIFLLILTSCNQIEYKYKIEGTIETKDGPHSAIWYVDTISFDCDTAYYFNSDGFSPDVQIGNIKTYNTRNVLI